jgi:hypothetical protein
LLFEFQIRDSELLLIEVEANKIVSSSAHEVAFVFLVIFSVMALKDK